MGRTASSGLLPLMICAALAGTGTAEAERSTKPAAATLVPSDVAAERYYRPIVTAAGVIEADGAVIRLVGVKPTSPDMACGSENSLWPCGAMARTATRRLVRGRALECERPDGSEGSSTTLECHVGGRNISSWLVREGWAAADGPRYASLEENARSAQRGLWSPVRTGIASQGIRGEVAVATTEPGEAPKGGESVRVEVDISEQRMTVTHQGAIVGNWAVSTARAGKITPTGRWRPQWLSRHHRSSLYDGAPMPYSVFFNGDYAVHGTYETGRLGRPASAGCVRLRPEHAAVVFNLVRTEGMQNTLIIVRR